MSETTITQNHTRNGGAATAEGVYVAPLGGGLVSLSANALPAETPVALLARLTREALRRRLTVVQGNFFGDPKAAAALNAAKAAAAQNDGGADFPVSVLGRHDTPAGDLRGGRVLALPADNSTLRRITGDGTAGTAGRPLGVAWSTAKARYVLLGALVPANLDAAPAEQSAQLWRDLKVLLAGNGFALTDITRTWFFNDHILDWYDGFNRVRTDFFNENDIFGTLVPASTGVGCSNGDGAALTLDVLAVQPLCAAGGAPLAVSAVPSPLQCPANDYKSAFSRAVEIAGDGGRHLSISGTASIAPSGETAHVGELDAQITLSLRVVTAILESRQMSWNDVTRAILYFPDISWMSRFEPCRTALGIPLLPALYAHCDICRGDLLFEIELDAFTEK